MKQTEKANSVIPNKNEPIMLDSGMWAKNPKVGYGLFLDEEGNKYWMPYETYNAAAMPAGMTFVGTVYKVDGNTAKILYKDPTIAKKWAEVVQWELELTDGQGVLSAGTKSFSVSLRRNNATSDNFTGTFTTSAETTAAFANEFNTWLHSQDNNWSCVVWTNGKARVQLDNYNHYNIDCVIVGISVTLVTGTEIKGITYLSRNNGISPYYGGCNFERFKYFFTTQQAKATPTSNVSDTSDDIYSSTVFDNSPYMADMRTLYGTFDNYLKARMVKFPSSRGIMAEEFRDGLKFTNTLAPITCTKYYGTTSATTVPLYPCANYCSQISFPSSGLTAGCWSSPSVYELMELHSIITYGLPGINADNCDIVSKAQLKFGGTPLSTDSYLWTPCLYAGQYAWCFDGCVGFVYGLSFYGSFDSCPIAKIKIWHEVGIQ